MALILDAACFCSTGKVRKNNEDNLYFDGRILEAANDGLKHPVSMTRELRREVCVAVFDGMGGGNYGEMASFTAASCMQKNMLKLNEFFIPEREFLQRICQELNDAVTEKTEELKTEHMGSTMTALYFSHNYVYVCNLGDSRAYRLRNGEFLQLSADHVEKRGEEPRRKQPLTQYLGIPKDLLRIDPYIAKGELERGDQYLLCSDGLTDMLSNLEIDEVLTRGLPTEETVKALIDKALENGGKDNVTAILCRIL